MADKFAELVATVSADTTKLTTGLSGASSSITKFGASSGAIFAGFAAAGVAAFAAITLAAKSAVDEFADFQEQLIKSTSIMGGLSREMSDEMERAALDMSLKSKFSAKELAEAYFFLASAGLDAKQSIAALGPVQEFATAGAFDLSTATDLLTDAQSALGLSSKDAAKNMEGMTRLSDILVKANTLANASVQQFSEALTNEAGAAIKQYNLDMTDSIAVLAAYADQGIKGMKAGSMFGRSVRLLTKAARDNEEEFEKMGIQVFDSSGEFRKFSDITEDMEKALGNLSTAEKAAALETLGFEARIQQAILPLIGASQKIREYDEGLKRAGGTTKEVADKQMQAFNNQVKLLENNFNLLKIEIGKELLPVAKDLLEVFNGIVTAMRGAVEISGKIGFRRIAASVATGRVATDISSGVSSATASSATRSSVGVISILLQMLGVQSKSANTQEKILSEQKNQGTTKTAAVGF
jgi:TP901 family phage tail tape measure protein